MPRARCPIAAGLVLAAAATAAVAQQQVTETVYWDTLDPAGRLTGGTFLLTRPAFDPANLVPPPGLHVESFTDTPNPANRVDLVLVGDGYQASQLGLYAAHAQTAMDQLFAQEPFKAYRPLFNIHRVDVVSVDSGVDNDPVQGISRNTALDMGFWCGGTERALCVSVNKAYQHAAAAPFPPDQVIAVANSTKYGGVGYPSSNACTLSGGNAGSAEIAIHELGHALGNLADEYTYDGPATYTGPERSEPNASIRTAAQMTQLSAKWYRWLGDVNPLFDSPVGTYEGCNYSQFGIYRPSNNSKMRALNRPFNMPSVESLIVEIYKIVKPIDDSTPTSQVLSGSSVPFVDPVDPVDHALAIQWELSGQPIAGATGETLDIAALHLAPAPYTLSVRVTDTTPWVRNEALRTQWMSQRISWNLIIETPCYADCNADGSLNLTDFGCFQTAFSLGQPYADCNGDQVLNLSDFGCFQTKFALGCP